LEQLKQFFSQVTISRYPDQLHVTEVEPIITYIRSSIHAKELSEVKLENMRLDLEKELKEKGKIFIRKDSGLFEAVK
jgi:G:T/U-mismatch repair DNA glycosylase